MRCFLFPVALVLMSLVAGCAAPEPDPHARPDAGDNIILDSLTNPANPLSPLNPASPLSIYQQ